MILVIDKTEAKGGIVHEVVSVTPGVNARKTKVRETTIQTTDPQPGLTKEMNALVGKADYLVRSVCAYTDVGWLLSGDRYPRLKYDYTLIEELAHGLNAKARALGASRRVKAKLVYTSFIDVDQGIEAARESAITGLSELANILESQKLRDDDTASKTSKRSPWRPALLRLANLETVLASAHKRQFEYLLGLAVDGRTAFLGVTRAERASSAKLKALLAPYVDEIRQGCSKFV